MSKRTYIRMQEFESTIIEMRKAEKHGKKSQISLD